MSPRLASGPAEKVDRFGVEDFASSSLVGLPPCRELPRGNIRQRAVRPVLIVVSLPLQDLVLCVSDGEEQLDVEMLIPQTPIEGLDEGIGRVTCPDGCTIQVMQFYYRFWRASVPGTEEPLAVHPFPRQGLLDVVVPPEPTRSMSSFRSRGQSGAGSG